jgi:diguanylate cyclase (GGDEF)-like protein/PAS domain S-box-containing protein
MDELENSLTGGIRIDGQDDNGALVRLLFDNAAEGMVVLDASGMITSVNESFTQITGIGKPDCLGAHVESLRAALADESVAPDVMELLGREGSWVGEAWFRRKNGEAYLAQATITVLTGADGAPLKYAAVFRDITGTKRQDDVILHKAYHDHLTGLPNRLLFMDRLKEAVSRTRRSGKTLTVMFLDLDNFKNVNDVMGHAAGDQLLKEAAVRLTECLRKVDTVARLGGDEFTMLLENVENENNAVLVSNKVIRALTQPFIIKGETVHVSASIGISLCPHDADSVETLMKNADLAMYHAKGLGKGNFQFYTKAMNERVVKRIHLEKDLRAAIDNNELMAYYQPKTRLDTGLIVGMEALVRWRRLGGNLIPPSDFIPLAEETGLIVRLDDFMLREASAFARGLKDKNIGDVYISINVSVNLSAIVFERKDLVETISDRMSEMGLEPRHLELEVTESSIIKDIDAAVTTISRLRERGFNVSMDDFGTGYSSLSYLTKLPINILKIDRSFVMHLEEDEKARLITKNVVAMAHDLGIKLVAEGVETKGQVDFLREVGCDEIQGYYVSPPVPLEKMEEFLVARRGERFC